MCDERTPAERTDTIWRNLTRTMTAEQQAVCIASIIGCVPDKLAEELRESLARLEHRK